MSPARASLEHVGLNSHRNKRRPESLRTLRRLISAVVRVGSYTIGMNRHAANPGAEAVTADPTHPPFEVGDLFRDYGPAYRAEHALTREQSTALTALANCRTKELGGHIDQCDQCGYQQNSYNSCRNTLYVRRKKGVKADVYPSENSTACS